MDYERRPNPPGWTQPRAPYNPYDINDVRPPQGYPSEFKPPGKVSVFSEIPRDLSQYERMKFNMRKLQYTPRPRSELYPGRYKVLRRVSDNQRYNRGVKLSSNALMLGTLTFFVFFYDWNEGFDNCFSKFYKWQLHWRDQLLDNLNDKQKLELAGLNPMAYTKYIKESAVPLDIESSESEVGLQRPTKRQYLELERLLEQRELEQMQESVNKKKWFGIF